jgi:Trk K+ transport system NAD-binding subunit
MKLRTNRGAEEESFRESAEREYYVLGGGHVGASVARRLQEDGHSVTVVDETHDSDEVPGFRDDPGTVRALERAGVADGSTVVVATPSDSRNLLTAQLVRTGFDVSDIVVLVNAPDRFDLFEEVGYETICATTTLSDGVVGSLREKTTREHGQTV